MATAICDMCLKPNQTGTRYCDACRTRIAEKKVPQDCDECGGKKTIHPTYDFEGDYSEPYICHNCLKDTHGRQWGYIPETTMDVYREGSPIEPD